LFVLGPGGCTSVSPPALEDFAQVYPSALFFRQPEYEARDGEISYEEWEKRYLPLDGIVGKVLSEEIYYTQRNNLNWFLQYKARNPSKMVLLHYNGTGRRATDETTTKFFSGHWLYYKGTRLTKPISNRTQKVLRVQDTSVFKMKRYRTGVADDIAIVRVDANGRPRWETAEHVRITGIDPRNKTITVQRGRYGTRKNTFPKGSYLAAHVTTGPYRFNDAPQNNIPLWAYNFSTLCPKDARGRNCGDALADYLAEKLGPGGDLSSFDGITIDVFSWVIRFGHPIRNIDVNTDGRADSDMMGGVNVVGLGANRFLRALRERLGSDKLILSDGHIPGESQRGFEHLNGIESEGYPDMSDFMLDHLSRGENIFNFWRANSASPSFNYANFKYKQTRPKRYRNTFIEPNLSRDRSYRKLRLALASALFTDSAFAYGVREEGMPPEVTMPPEVMWRDKGVKARVFDELWKGTAQQPHWLGQPLGPPVHLAQRTPDLLEGRGQSWPDLFVERFEGRGVAFSRAGTQEAPILAIRSTNSSERELSFMLPGIEVAGKDLFISLRLRAEPLEGFPASVPRQVEVWAVPSGEAPKQLNKEFSWAGGEPFEATLYYQDVGPGTVHLKSVVEGGQRVFFEKITAHSAADGRYREYEGGIVFANPSTREYTFNVGVLFKELLDSGVMIRRIEGTANQDPLTNDGSEVGEQLTLSAKNALFVEKVKPPAG
jgi:hypothetical protein